MSSVRWLFLRHGESQGNAEGWWAGRRDAPLTDRGRAQAEEASAPVLAASPKRAFASTLSRARDTAEIVLRGQPIPLSVHADLCERSLGEWEGQNIELMRRNGSMATLLAWEGRPPQGESQGDIARRVVPFLASIDAPIDTLVVAHGGVIRVLLGLLDGTRAENIGKYKVRNAELICRNLDVGAWARLQAALL